MSIRTRSDYSSDHEMTDEFQTEEPIIPIAPAEREEIKQIFSQHIPVIGKIPMVFYIPPCQSNEVLQQMIKRNGGRVVDQHECFTYQIKPEQEKTSFEGFYTGPIYSAKWIQDSIASGKIQNKDDYFICINIHEKAKLLNIGKKKKYTIMEGIKLYETLTNHKNLQINSSQFWLKAQKQGILPERTADSMKNFWKKNEFRTLEEYLIESIHEETDFCLSFKEIPNPEFVQRFKKQYANEFLKLQTFLDLEKGSDEQGKSTPNAGKFNGRSTPSHPHTPTNFQQLLSSAFKEETKSNENASLFNTSYKKTEELKYQFKPLQKLSKDNLSYSINEYEYYQPHIYLSIDKRPLEACSLEQEVENLLSQRMKKFVPTNFDLVDYDKELFKKQMDLETVQITIERDEEREMEYEVKPYYVRSAVRYPNEEGMFRRLQLELTQIGQEYAVSDEDINKLFIQVCCSKAKLIEALKGQSFTKWNELEDLALSRGTESMEYNYLLKTKGPEEILRRKIFIGL